MKVKQAVIFIAVFFAALHVQAEDQFTGQKKAACEAIMCLSTGSPPHECDDALDKYFKIKVKSTFGINPKKTLEARKNFLKLCPTNNAVDDDKMVSDTSTDLPAELAVITSARLQATSYCKSVKKLAIDAKVLKKCIATMTAEYARNNCKKFESQERVECLRDINDNL